MRHTFASYFNAGCTDLNQLMTRLGHSQSTTTLRHYVRLVDNKYWEEFWTLCAGIKIPPLPDDLAKKRTLLLNLQ